jgi:hypothetical protein
MLTESEIFDRMSGCLRAAASCAVQLARGKRRASLYDNLRKNLSMAGDCCRQAAAWREDCRWLEHDTLLAMCRKKAGDWLRGYKDPLTGRKVMLAIPLINDLFAKLAQQLTHLHNVAIDLRDKATGRVGMILPRPRAEPGVRHRPQRVMLPPGMMATTGGLVIPSGSVH